MTASPTELLEHEHRLIEKAVSAMRTLADALQAGRPVAGDTLRQVADFMRTYADQCHHGKEEAILFPLLVSKGVPTQGCPIGALTWEHGQGRTLVGEYLQAVEAYCRDIMLREPIVNALHALVDLYPGHIWKEDYLLFPMTNKILAPADQEALAAQFEAADAALGDGVQGRFARLAEALAAAAAAG